ncbi:MAG: M48 family metalloprotease [Planctomycetota bacterium]
MTRFVNNTKTVLLLGALTGLFVAIGGMLGQNFLLPFLLMGIAMNFGAFFFSDKIAIASMRGKEVGEGDPLYEMVDELRQRAGLPMPRVYVCPQQAPNAFATGRSPSKAAVAVTAGAMQLLNEQEMRGVMAHELAHIKNRDTLTSTIAATVAGVLAFVAQWGFFILGGRSENGNPLVLIAVVILGAVGAALIKAMISRSREFVADADGAAIAGSPDGLMSALAKLESLNRRIPMQNPNPAQNNLFIVEPFAGESLTKLFATHPPTEQRIAALRKSS